MQHIEQTDSQSNSTMAVAPRSLIGADISQCPVLNQLEFEAYHEDEIKKLN